jgi:hypothetical protein
MGAGLLRLKPPARTVTIGFCVFYGVNTVLFISLPGYTQRLNALIAVLPAEVRSAQSRDYPSTMVRWPLICALMYAVPIWFLVARRKAFLGSNDTMVRKLL